MNSLAILIWLLLSQAAFAQTVVVKSGDHPGFTRLVLELPGDTDWQMGRTAGGYELRLADRNLRFDVTGVFKEIQRNRLAAIWMDPVNGGLHLGIACACHALPFEFRAGIIVIDLRDGPPPKGSAFEVTLAGTNTSVLAARPAHRPRARPRRVATAENPASLALDTYDWLMRPPADHQSSQRIGPKITTVIGQDFTDITPLKDALLRQLSLGAAQGIVQMAQPSLASRNATGVLPTGPRANIRLGEAPGFRTTTAPEPPGALAKDGAACIPDDMMDVSGWSNGRPVVIQLSDSRASLLGEFDKPNPSAVIAATKLLIHLGFGAEARQMLIQIPVEDPDRNLWMSMAKLVDGGTDPTGPFQGMHRCDTAAALWAVLAMPQLTKGEMPRSEAVLRAFSALPMHLRRSLGPILAARFLAIDEIATARTLSNAVRRGESDAQPDVAVMQAKIDLAAGDPMAAAAALEPILAQAGPLTAPTLIALVDAHLAAGEAVGPETPVALAALIREQAGSAIEPALRRAQILALGLSGDFDQAFALLPKMTGAEQDLWTILANSGADTAILNHAVLPQDGAVPPIPAAERSKIAGRLMALGLSDAALNWIGPHTGETGGDDRIVAARANVAKGVSEAALAWLAGLDDSSASDLRAQALWQLGKPAEAAKAWAEATNTEAEMRAQRWARNWAQVAKTDAPDWQAAAALLDAGAGDDVAGAAGPLAIGTALVADSAATRATLSSLFSSVRDLQPNN